MSTRHVAFGVQGGDIMRERLVLTLAFSIVAASASATQAETSTAAGMLSGLSGYTASVGNSLKAMIATLDHRIAAMGLRPSTSSVADLPPIAVVKFSTTNTDGNPVPCELTLAKMRAVLASVAPSSSNKARFEDLKSRGIERCRANDDAQANAYLSEALGMIGR